MRITQSFEVARPLATVWDLFQDVPTVASCMPGAELTADKGGGLYAGRVSMKLGPFGASFEGEAQVTADPMARSGHAEGRGVDKKGGSRSKLVMDYRLAEAGKGTRVDIDADIQLSGPIAQFGRTGIITETANVLIKQFVKNVETKLGVTPVAEEAPGAPESPAAPKPTDVDAKKTAPPSNELSVLKILALLIASFFRRLLGGKA